MLVCFADSDCLLLLPMFRLASICSGCFLLHLESRIKKCLTVALKYVQIVYTNSNNDNVLREGVSEVIRIKRV